MTMIERVARAIWEHATPIKPGPWNDALQLWDRADDREKRLALMQARIAIAAMREPTEEMVEAGEKWDSATEFGAGPLYSAMIDAELER